MAKNLNKDLKSYYREIEELLPCKKAEKKAMMGYIKSAVNDYISKNPNATFDDITKQIGAPNQVVEHYYNGEKAKELAEQLKRNRKIAAVIAVVVVVAFIGLAILFAGQVDGNDMYGDRNTISDVSNSDSVFSFEN